MRHNLWAFVTVATLACGGAVDESSAAAETGAIVDSASPDVPPTDTAVDATAPETGGTPGIACGAAVCTSPARCEICRPDLPDSPRVCTTSKEDVCKTWGARPPLRMSCDDHSDCAPDARCAVVEGSSGTYTQCVSMPMTDCKSFAKIVCTTLADCPPCATRCAPYGGATYPVSTCQ